MPERHKPNIPMTGILNGLALTIIAAVFVFAIFGFAGFFYGN
jgi:hypothetical protein